MIFMHEHRHQGQKLHHWHEGSDKVHTYFEHPEDVAVNVKRVETLQEAHGEHAAIRRVVCDGCGWTGPQRALQDVRDLRLLQHDGDGHACQ